MIPITKWAGLVTNASQYAIPPGATVEQVNLQCLAPGQLTVRPGMSPVVFSNPATSGLAIVRAFRYQHGSGEHIVYQDAQGNIYSSVVSATSSPIISQPAAPVITSALPGNATISVSVNAPAATGGAAITGYSFQVSTDGGATWTAAGSSSSTSHTIVGLANGVGYRVRAAASNESGQGDYSNTFGPVAPRAPVVGPASPPSLVSATASSFNTASVSWYTPADNGGSAITGYSIQQSADRGLTWSTASSVGLVSSATVSGLAAGTDFVFRVAAITAYGPGQYSTSSNSVSVIGSSATPSQPQNLSGIATDTSVTLSWAAPASDGGSSIVSYSIRYGTSAQGPWTVQAASGLSGTVSGLPANTRYTFGVYATNANGAGQIASLDVTTLAESAATAPSAPTNLVLTRTADGFSATWDAPATTGGSTITAYRLTTASSSTGQETQVYNNLTRSYTATGIVPGSTVWVAVYAINSVGSSTAMRASVTVGLAPSAPRNFTATPTSTQVALSWSPPDTLYGQQITGYALTYTEGYAEQVAGNATSNTLVPVAGQPYATGASYTYTIAAITSAGTGATASVTFTVPSPPPVPPGPVQNLVLTPTDSGFVASWDAPINAGAPSFIGYKTYVLSGGVWTLKDTRPATSRTYQATGYPVGTAINVRVTAYSSAAESTPTAGSVTPYTIPTAVTGLTAVRSFQNTATFATLSWTAPSSLGGNALLKYRVFADDVEVEERWITRPTATSAYLQLGSSSSTFTVAAETAAGTGPKSNAVTVNAYVWPVKPPAPTLAVVSTTSGVLRFTASSPMPAGMSVMYYEGQVSLDSGVTWSAATSVPGGISQFPTSSPGVEFYASVPYVGATSRTALARARASTTSDGFTATSDWSASLSATVTFSAPVFSPTITSTELGGGKVRILWTAPASTGGSPITNYAVVYSGTGVTTTTYNAGTSLQFDLTRQTTTAATIVVRATNALGTSSASPYTLPAVLPSPGWALVEINGSPYGVQPNSNGTVKLRASHPIGIEWQTIDFYRWQSSPDGVTWTTLADTPTTDDAQGREYTATSQPSGIRYYRSLVSIGGTLSPPSLAQSKPTAPGVVRSASLSQPSPNSTTGQYTATVSWTGSLYDGGRAITAYELQMAWTIGYGEPATWSDTVEHSVATYGAGPYSRSVSFPVLPSDTSDPPVGQFQTFWVRIRAAVSRDFSDPLRAGVWQYLTR